MNICEQLNHEQEEAIGLLQVWTLLEYFDLMLCVHMAVLMKNRTHLMDRIAHG